MRDKHLKPCPFCGEAEKLIIEQPVVCGPSRYLIMCGNIGCRICGSTGFTEEEAIEKWNTRTGCVCECDET